MAQKQNRYRFNSMGTAHDGKIVTVVNRYRGGKMATVKIENTTKVFSCAVKNLTAIAFDCVTQ